MKPVFSFQPRLLPTTLVLMLATSVGMAASACQREPGDAPRAKPANRLPTSATSTPSARSASSHGARSASAKSAISDKRWSTWVMNLSETGGSFPSDNFVSNETSYLHPIKQIRHAPHQGVYIGVGPEQNFTYIAAHQPQLAFLFDIRRDNFLLHNLYKVLFEQCATRAEFLERLFSRPKGSVSGKRSLAAMLKQAQGAAGVGARSAELMGAVSKRAGEFGVVLSTRDRSFLRRAIAEFRKQGPAIHYTMKNSARHYPSFGELAVAKDGEGREASFLASADLYGRLRRMHRQNRIIPLVGNAAGQDLFPRLAKVLKARHAKVSLFYISNVEQYIFHPNMQWKQWLGNLEGLPWAPDAKLLRVYFDQGRAHPKQQKGHRTTSLLVPAKPFLKHAGDKPYASWWKVSTDNF